MITPKGETKAYTFEYQGVKGAFWEDREIIATTFLLAETQDKYNQEAVLDELEHFACSKGKKLYITNFCSRSLIDLMDERRYLRDNWKFQTQEGTWQIDVRYYTPKGFIRESRLPLVPFVGYNKTEQK